jgi:glycerol-3-phosphate dehydrogenase
LPYFLQVLYYDGHFDDARFNVALACTAAAAGGVVANYMDCKQLIKVVGGGERLLRSLC